MFNHLLECKPCEPWRLIFAIVDNAIIYFRQVSRIWVLAIAYLLGWWSSRRAGSAARESSRGVLCLVRNGRLTSLEAFLARIVLYVVSGLREFTTSFALFSLFAGHPQRLQTLLTNWAKATNICAHCWFGKWSSCGFVVVELVSELVSW